MRPLYSFTETHSNSVKASAHREKSFLQLQFLLSGKNIKFPANGATPQRKNELWKHTCCEAFISKKGESSYYELNVSPSRDWNLYFFSNYREGMRECSLEQGLDVRTTLNGDELALTVSFELGKMENGFQLRDSPLQISLSAVVELVDGSHLYWALRHCGQKPDFHRRESFILEI